MHKLGFKGKGHRDDAKGWDGCGVSWDCAVRLHNVTPFQPARLRASGGVPAIGGEMTGIAEWIKSLIDADNLHAFYTCSRWLHLRAEVLAEDHGECQDCKAKGRYRKATTVHHENHVRRHPELALEKYYIDRDGIKRRNLISLCHDCHEIRHGRRQTGRKQPPLTKERW